MFFRKWIFDAYKNRSKFSIHEPNKIVLKSLLSSENYSLFFRFYFFQLLKKYPRYSSLSFYRRYCNLTGTRSLYSGFLSYLDINVSA